MPRMLNLGNILPFRKQSYNWSITVSITARLRNINRSQKGIKRNETAFEFSHQLDTDLFQQFLE